jgi:hypothetical protein
VFRRIESLCTFTVLGRIDGQPSGVPVSNAVRSGRATPTLRSSPRPVCSLPANPVRLRLPIEGGAAMSVVVRFNPTNVTQEKYDESLRRLKETGEWPPEGMQLHVLFGSEGDLKVSEIWDSEEQLRAFGERLMPILSDIGIEFSGQPDIFEAHNIITR